MSHIFKPGDKVKCAFFGDEVITLIECQDDGEETPLKLDKPEYFETFTTDGRYNQYHTHPILTLVEAKKEPMRLECEVDFSALQYSLTRALSQVGPTTLPLPANWTEALVGKRGKLIFEEKKE